MTDFKFTRVYTSGRLTGGQIAKARVEITVDFDALVAAARDLHAYGDDRELDTLTREAVAEHLREAVWNGCLTEDAAYRWFDNNSDARTEAMNQRVADLFPEAAPDAF